MNPFNCLENMINMIPCTLQRESVIRVNKKIETLYVISRNHMAVEQFTLQIMVAFSI